MCELWLGFNTYIDMGISVKAKPLLLQEGCWEIISYPSWVVVWVMTKHRLLKKFFVKLNYLLGIMAVLKGPHGGCPRKAM